jgi:hypothetical protein
MKIFTFIYNQLSNIILFFFYKNDTKIQEKVKNIKQ